MSWESIKKSRALPWGFRSSIQSPGKGLVPLFLNIYSYTLNSNIIQSFISFIQSVFLYFSYLVVILFHSITAEASRSGFAMNYLALDKTCW